MKQQKSFVEKEDSSLKGLLKVAVVGFVVLALFLIFSSRNTAPKITPEVSDKTSLVCSQEYYPVCGKDGKTYTNSCSAEKIADVRVAYVGECRDTASGASKEVTSAQTGSENNTGSEVPAIVPKETVIPENTGSTEPVPSTEAPSVSVVLSGATDSASGAVDPSLSTYSNANYHYSFSMPKSSYYQAFWAQNGASHSVGINTGTGAETLASSQIRVYFYANKVVGKLTGAENGFYTDTTTNTVYILLNEKDSVAIESDNPNSDIVQTIIKTIHKDE